MINYWEKESNYTSRDYRSRNFKGDWTKHFINSYIDSVSTIGNYKTQAKFYDYKNEHLPKSLYKFFPPSHYSLMSIMNQSVHLSSPREFNDPFDSYICVEEESYVKQYILKEIKENYIESTIDKSNSFSHEEYWQIYHSRSKDIPEKLYFPLHKTFSYVVSEILKNKSQDFQDTLKKLKFEAYRECKQKVELIRNIEFRISCFSNFKSELELLDNSTMWSHYADKHKGFCVKYKLNFNSLKEKEIIMSGLFPVKYTSNAPNVSPRELMKLKFSDDGIELNKNVLKTTMKSLITKSRFWNYENEWRLIVNKESSLPFLNFNIPFLEIDRIYLGCRIENGLKETLIKLAEDQNVEIYQTSQSNEKYRLDRSLEDLKSLRDNQFYEKLNRINQIDDKEERFERSYRLIKQEGEYKKK